MKAGPRQGWGNPNPRRRRFKDFYERCPHTLKWRYVKNGSGKAGDDCGWVDFVQWTGPSPDQDPSNWQEIAYKHDVAGRRVEKRVDGYSTRYVYDGPHVIAEYDGNNNLLRKYIYGPGIDEPISMIEVAEANTTYYYHFDALGSVVALSNSSGDTVQTYQYSVYGEVAVEDPNHPNPYMFAGVRYDIEIGLYYNRARYYNPFTGRFLQTDPVADGMNLYAYCGNDPTSRADPSGLSYRFLTEEEALGISEMYRGRMVFVDDDGGKITVLWDGNDINGWIDWAQGNFGTDWAEHQSGWTLAGTATDETQEWWFWRIKALMFLDRGFAVAMGSLENGVRHGRFSLKLETGATNRFVGSSMGGTMTWDPTTSLAYDGSQNWHKVHPLVALAHELTHAVDAMSGVSDRESIDSEVYAMQYENRIRYALWKFDPTQSQMYPRPGYDGDVEDLGSNAAEAWSKYDPSKILPPGANKP